MNINEEILLYMYYDITVARREAASSPIQSVLWALSFFSLQWPLFEQFININKIIADSEES